MAAPAGIAFEAAIESIEVVEVQVPKSARNRIAAQYGTIPDSHFAIVLVRAGGLTGIGEAATEQWWTGEDAATVRHIVETFLAPVLVGRAVGPREALALMDANVVGHPYAKSAVEIALWDLLGKSAGLPLHVLLGGAGDRPEHRRVAIKYVIGMGDAELMRRQVEFGRGLGFRHFKTKVGGPLREDLDRVGVIAAALEPGETIGVDANAGWSPTDARQALGPLHDLGVSFIEQPVSPELPEVMAALTARSTVPVVAHESIFSVRDGVEAAAARVADIWALTPSTHGGVGRTLDLLAIARAAGITCLLGSNIELGVSTAMMVQVGAAFADIRDCPVPSDIIGPLYHEDDIVTVAPLIADGYAHLPAGPGLGVELDWEKVERHRRS